MQYRRNLSGKFVVQLLYFTSAPTFHSDSPLRKREHCGTHKIAKLPTEARTNNIPPAQETKTPFSPAWEYATIQHGNNQNENVVQKDGYSSKLHVSYAACSMDAAEITAFE